MAIAPAAPRHRREVCLQSEFRLVFIDSAGFSVCGVTPIGPEGSGHEVTMARTPESIHLNCRVGMDRPGLVVSDGFKNDEGYSVGENRDSEAFRPGIAMSSFGRRIDVPLCRLFGQGPYRFPGRFMDSSAFNRRDHRACRNSVVNRNQSPPAEFRPRLCFTRFMIYP